MEKICIVLAEDDEDDRLLFSEAIEQLNLNIELKSFLNGVELLSYLKQNDTVIPDLVFLDLNMPIMGGIECLIEIRKCSFLKDLSLAIYSTSNSEDDMENCLVNGANIYIRKPPEFDSLKTILHKVITVNHQYDGLSMSKENFLMVI